MKNVGYNNFLQFEICNYMPNHNQTIGQLGEDIAAAYLQSIGYKIHTRNVQVGRSEIDIIAYDPSDKAIVFAEVKARQRAHSDFHPLLNWTPAKRRALLRGARRWVAEHEFDKGFRVDLICVVAGQVTQHIKEINA